MSIDAPNAELHTGSATDSSFNYIDSFVEYVAEVVLKYDNAIPENKDRQQKELQLHKQFQIVLEQFQTSTTPSYTILKLRAINNYNDRYAFQFIKEINPPPPKGIC